MSCFMSRLRERRQVCEWVFLGFGPGKLFLDVSVFGLSTDSRCFYALNSCTVSECAGDGFGSSFGCSEWFCNNEDIGWLPLSPMWCAVTEIRQRTYGSRRLAASPSKRRVRALSKRNPEPYGWAADFALGPRKQHRSRPDSASEVGCAWPSLSTASAPAVAGRSWPGELGRIPTDAFSLTGPCPTAVNNAAKSGPADRRRRQLRTDFPDTDLRCSSPEPHRAAASALRTCWKPFGQHLDLHQQANKQTKKKEVMACFVHKWPTRLYFEIKLVATHHHQ